MYEYIIRRIHNIYMILKKKTKLQKPSISMGIIYYKEMNKPIQNYNTTYVQAKRLITGDIFTFFNPKLILPSYYEVIDNDIQNRLTCEPSIKVYKINTTV